MNRYAIVVGASEQRSSATILEGLLKQETYSVEESRDGSDIRLLFSGNSKVVSLGDHVQGTQRDVRREYVIDPARGFLMVRENQSVNGDRTSLVYALTDIKQCSEERWFPMRSVILSPPSPNGGTVTVTEIKVLSLDVDTPPDHADFAIVLEKGTQINDARDPRTAFRIDEDTQITPDDLPTLFKRADAALAARTVADPLPAAQAPRRTWLIAVNLVGLILIVAALLIRWARNRQRTSG